MARIKKTYSRPKNTPPTKRRRDQAIKAKNKPKKKRKIMKPMPLPSPFDPNEFKRPPIMTPYKPKPKGLKGLLGGIGNKAKKAAKKVAKRK